MSARKEEWRDIPGYDGWYQISDWGRIRSFRDPHHKGIPLKIPVMLNPTRGTYSTYIVVRWDGKQKTLQVGKAVAITFLGDIPKGCVAYHKDGNTENNALTNIGIGPRSELSRERMRNKVAGRNRKPVVKIDRNLAIVDAYPSTSAAARANGYRQDAMWRFCTLAIGFSVFAPDDFIYTFDEDKWVRKALRRAKTELDAMNARYNNPYTECYYDLPDIPGFDISTNILWSEVLTLAGGASDSHSP